MKENNKYVYTASSLSYLMLGMAVICIGQLLPSMMAHYDMSYAQSGTMIFMMSIGSFITTTSGGALSKRFGNKSLAVLGSAFFTLCFLGILIVDSVLQMYVCWLIAGLGWGFYNVAMNAMVAENSDNDPKAITRLHSRFAIGAIFTPIIIGTLEYFGLSWKIFIGLAAVLAIVVTVMMSFVKTSNQHTVSDRSKVDLSFLKNKYVYLFMALFFMYVGSESAINGWMVTYLTEYGIVTGVIAKYFVSILWALILAGRIINMQLSEKVSIELRIMVSAVIIFIMFVLFINTSNVLLIVFSVIMLGLAMSAVYPNAVSNTYKKIPGNATAHGLIFSLGSLGSAIIPWINGVVADNVSLNAGMMVVYGTTFLLVGLSIINYFGTRQRADNEVVSGAIGTGR